MSFGLASLFFFSGIIFYIFLSRILQYVKVIKLIAIMNYHTLSLVKYVEEIYVNTLKFSREKMEKSKDFSKEELRACKEVDEEILETFRKDCIRSFSVVYPKYIHRNLPFDNWDKAMIWLRQIEKGIYPLNIPKE